MNCGCFHQESGKSRMANSHSTHNGYFHYLHDSAKTRVASQFLKIPTCSQVNSLYDDLILLVYIEN